MLPDSQPGPAAVPRTFMLVQSSDKTWTWNVPAKVPELAPRCALHTATLPWVAQWQHGRFYAHTDAHLGCCI